MPFVVDVSFAAGWFLPSQANPTATDLAARLESEFALVPNLFRHELRNLLLCAFRRKKISEDMLHKQIERAERFPLHESGSGDTVFTIRLALEHGLTAYDATYLALAMTRRVAIATNESAIVKAARKERIDVITRLPS